LLLLEHRLSSLRPSRVDRMKRRMQRRRFSPEPWRGIAAKWGITNPFELFGDDSLFRVLGELLEGQYVSLAEFHRVLRANKDRQIPPSLLRMIRALLKHQGPTRRGRPARDYFAVRARVVYARILYERYLAWLQSRARRPGGLKGWSCIRRASWWKDKPHECAARMVTRRVFQSQNVDRQHVRNLIFARR